MQDGERLAVSSWRIDNLNMMCYVYAQTAPSQLMGTIGLVLVLSASDPAGQSRYRAGAVDRTDEIYSLLDDRQTNACDRQRRKAVSDGSKSIQEQIKELERQLLEAQARIPEHDPPMALLLEIDELEEELDVLRAKVEPATLAEQIQEVELKLKDALARIPKHTPPTGLMIEIEELEEELERLQGLQKDG
jgi:hypothetical protein